MSSCLEIQNPAFPIFPEPGIPRTEAEEQAPVQKLLSTWQYLIDSLKDCLYSLFSLFYNALERTRIVPSTTPVELQPLFLELLVQ